jgi:hypothetical protein
MKINHIINTFAISAITVFAFFANSCKEVGPQIDLTNGKHNVLVDTTYVESPAQLPEAKNVLIEMFTGVSCQNCPTAHATLDGLISSHAPNVIGMAMHTSSEPVSQDGSLPGTTQVLSCPDADALLTFFGDPGGRPTGGVDRTIHNDAFGTSTPGVLDYYSNWSGYTGSELAIPTPVNLLLSKTYVDASKSLTIAVELHYTAAQADSDKLSIFLTEDSIISSQLLPNQSIDSGYVHNGILRAAVTNVLGDKINASLVAGTVVRKIYTYTISNSLWKPNHMNIIALVHKYQNGNITVLQSKTTTVK